MNVTQLGVLFLGGFIGLVLGLALKLPKSPSWKLATSAIGAALGGSPVLFMEGLAQEKWIYPIGLVLGFLWVRLINARDVLSGRPKKAQRVAWFLGWVDTAAILIVTGIAIAFAAAGNVKQARQNEVDLSRCEAALQVVLDDRPASQSRYHLRVLVEGVLVFDEMLLGRLPKGSPYQGPFTNWTDLQLDLQNVKRSSARPEFTLALSSTDSGDWVGVADIRVSCGGKERGSHRIRELHDYGPNRTPTGIIYGGSSKTWHVPLDVPPENTSAAGDAG